MWPVPIIAGVLFGVPLAVLSWMAVGLGDNGGLVVFLLPVFPNPSSHGRTAARLAGVILCAGRRFAGDFSD